MDLSLDIPLNGLSFGQTATCLLRELYNRKLEPNIFPVGNQGDLGAFNISQEFGEWIQHCMSKAHTAHKRSTPTFRLWHLNGALTSLADRRVLMTFHETDRLTEFELNAAANQDVVLVTSQYSKQIMEAAGLSNVVYCPLGFDSDSFFETHKTYEDDGIITFGIGGKLEHRKHHPKILRAWAKRYGNNPRYKLNMAISNSFINEQTTNAILHTALEGVKYFNINYVPHMKANRDYNEFLNANSIYIGMSGGEGFDLPLFQSVALGKHVVGLYAHAYKDYLTNENASLVYPNGMVDVYDGVFFHRGQPFNQGQIFSWDEDEFIAACEKAEQRYRTSKVNREGKKLRDEYTYAKTVDTILSCLT